ncbi:protein amalgam-like [Oculina patagonica]
MNKKWPSCAMLLVLGLIFLLYSQASWVSACVKAESTHNYPYAPTLEINTLEFPNEDILPTGYNITIVCTSNSSKKNMGKPCYYGQPFWIQQFFNDHYLGDCGGGDGSVDSEDSKVCTFVIQNSTKRNSGNYSCNTHNQLTCTFGTISLNFEKPSPPNFRLAPPRNINVFAGSTVNLTCEAKGIPRPVVTWYKDGRPVSRENISRVNAISLLTLESVGPHDQGEYWCEAQNAEGWNKSSRTSLRIFSKPTILRHPQNVSVYLEDKAIMVNFTCEASGFPRPVITWLKNNSPVTSGTVVQNGSISTLVLRLLKRKETPGKYKCVAKNSLGGASSTERALIIRTRTHNLVSNNDNSTSPGVSKVVWISVATGAVFLIFLVISICLVYNKCKKKMNDKQRFPHLHINEDIMGQLRNEQTPPRYQMTIMKVQTN